MARRCLAAGLISVRGKGKLADGAAGSMAAEKKQGGEGGRTEMLKWNFSCNSFARPRCDLIKIAVRLNRRKGNETPGIRGGGVTGYKTLGSQ